tara:strand:- start:809 stop:1924 length:1116 start_codon:yes stop_codon:yes gene_type:complete
MVCVFLPDVLIGYGKIMLYILLIIFITFLIVLIGMRKSIKNNWSLYKCNPIILPFANLFGYSPSKTFTECLSSNVQQTAGDVVKPYDDLFSALASVSNTMSESLQDVRSVMQNIGLEAVDKYKGIMQKMSNMSSTSQFMMLKIQSIFQKLLALYITLLYFAWSMVKGLEAMIRDPNIRKSQKALEEVTEFIENPGGKFKDLGKAIKEGVNKAGKGIKKGLNKAGKGIKKGFCFAPNTRVLMNNGQYKYIQKLNVGDMLWDNNMVEGTMTFTGKNANLVVNSGIVSTYDHHILHNGQFIKSGNVPGSQRLAISVDYLFDIDTSNHRIIILDNQNKPVTYTDYTEVDDETGKVYEYELNLLNYQHSQRQQINV